MSQATRNLEIHSATFAYLCGSIEFTARPSTDRHMLHFSSSDGMTLDGKRTNEQAVLKILGELHWDWQTFVACWQGWASGFEAGRDFEQAEKYRRQAASK